MATVISKIYKELRPGNNHLYYPWKSYSLPEEYGKKIDQIRSELSDGVIINMQKSMAQRYGYMVWDKDKQTLTNELNKVMYDDIVDNFNKNNKLMQLIQSVVFNKFKETNFSAVVGNSKEKQGLKQGDKLNLQVLQELTDRYQQIVDMVLTTNDKNASYNDLDDYKKHFANLQNDINRLQEFIKEKQMNGNSVKYEEFLGLTVKNLSEKKEVSLTQSLVGIGNAIVGQSLEDQTTFYVNNSDAFKAYQAINTGKIKVKGKSIKEDIMIFNNDLDFEFETVDGKKLKLKDLKNSQNNISITVENYEKLQREMKAAISAKTSMKMKNYSLHSDLTLANLLEHGEPIGEYYWALWHNKQISDQWNVTGQSSDHKDMVEYNRQLLNYEISRQLPRFIGEQVTFFSTPGMGIQDIWTYLSYIWAKNNYVHVSGTGWQGKKMSVILP